MWHGYCICIVMATKTERYMQRVLKTSRQMLAVADKCDLDADNNGCRIVCGVMRDYSYKLKALAEQEIKTHKTQNTFNPAKSIRRKEYLFLIMFVPMLKYLINCL